MKPPNPEKAEQWRARRARESMLAAATDLFLAEGATALTHQRVADAARVGRAAVCRHWATTDDLLQEVSSRLPAPFVPAPATDLTND